MTTSPRATRYRWRLVLAATMLTVAGGGVPGALAQDTPTPIQVIDADDLQLGMDPIDLADLTPLPGVQPFGFNDVEGRLLRGMTMPATASEYGFGDDPSGPPIINPPGTSLIGAGSVQARFDAPLDMPPSGTMTEDTLFLESGGGIVPGQDVTLIWFEFDSPVNLNSGLAINEGIVLARPDVPYWMSDFAGDTWEGGYLMPTVTYNPDPFALTAYRFDGSGFAMQDFPGFVYRHSNMMFVGVDSGFLAADGPLDELGYGLHLHWSDAPFTPGFVATYPERVGRTPEDFPIIRTNPAFAPNSYCCFVEPVEETTTTTTATTTTSEAPAETTEAPATTEATTTEAVVETTLATTETTIADGGNLDSGSFSRWVPIIVVIFGIAITVGGYFVYYKTRERPRPGGDAGGDGEQEEGDDGPRDTPPPAIYGEDAEHTSCDWAVYFHDGTKWVALRQPNFQSHECCVYRIRVETRIAAHVQVAKARQDAGDERLYMPDFDFAWDGLNLKGHTSTRSGPRGRLDWMHGLGDPTEQAQLASNDEYVQIGQGDEPPEVAVHLDHAETTRIHVWLEPKCPQYKNTYVGEGASTLEVMATQECTNDDPAPECPVELNAFGWTGGDVWGDLNYWLDDRLGTDIDEIEGLMRRRAELEPEARAEDRLDHSLRPLWDSHDHVARDRATYQSAAKNNDTQTIEADGFKIWVCSDHKFDSGQLVPVHVWPTTERVSTHIESAITHSIDIAGSMQPINCEATDCGGHGKCGCRPAVKLDFGGPATFIEVEDRKFPIRRDPSTADRRSPPSGGGYKSWKLA